MPEQWKILPGYDGRYAVSDGGRVWSRHSNRVLVGGTASGYRVVCLRLHGENRTELVHRLVLLTFLGPAPEGREACHGDGDRLNNRLDNLRWDTRSANTRDQVAQGRHRNARVTACPAGHAYDAANTYVRPSGQRDCLTCRRQRQAARRAAA